MKRIIFAAALFLATSALAAEPAQTTPQPDVNRIVGPQLPLVEWVKIYNAIDSKTLSNELAQAVQKADPAVAQPQKVK